LVAGEMKHGVRNYSPRLLFSCAVVR
jgi:hypothetical protein